MAAITFPASVSMSAVADHMLRNGQSKVAEGTSRDQGYARQRRKVSKRDKTTFEQRKVSDPGGAQKR
jgi:hypothetical protein